MIRSWLSLVMAGVMASGLVAVGCSGSGDGGDGSGGSTGGGGAGGGQPSGGRATGGDDATGGNGTGGENGYTGDPMESFPSDTKVIFLHHSTGGVIWGGGVEGAIAAYNDGQGTAYVIEERAYPNDPYPWENYPYDYHNIWVAHAGGSPYDGQDTLEILTQSHDVIVFKHCFPVSGIEADSGTPDVASNTKTIENYQAQYGALKTKLHEFPQRRFIVWTGAALIAGESNDEAGARSRAFFTWVKEEWDEPGDNIFVWDFFELETEGGNFLLDRYSAGDSHPNSDFATQVAPLFARRVIDVIEGRGDTGSLTGG